MKKKEPPVDNEKYGDVFNRLGIKVLRSNMYTGGQLSLEALKEITPFFKTIAQIRFPHEEVGKFNVAAFLFSKYTRLWEVVYVRASEMTQKYLKLLE